MSESALLSRIMLGIGNRPDFRAMRNNVGAFLDKIGRMVRYGLGVGSSDIIGIKTITITPDMVGQTVGIFCAIEVKDIKGRARPEQISFIRMIRKFGGRAGVARSLEDAQKIIQGECSGDDDIR